MSVYVFLGLWPESAAAAGHYGSGVCEACRDPQTGRETAAPGASVPGQIGRATPWRYRRLHQWGKTHKRIRTILFPSNRNETFGMFLFFLYKLQPFVQIKASHSHKIKTKGQIFIFLWGLLVPYHDIINPNPSTHILRSCRRWVFNITLTTYWFSQHNHSEVTFIST